MAKDRYRSLSGRSNEKLAPYKDFPMDLKWILGCPNAMVPFDVEAEPSPRQMPDGEMVTVNKVGPREVVLGVARDGTGIRTIYRVGSIGDLSPAQIAGRLKELGKFNWRARAKELREEAERSQSEKVAVPRQKKARAVSPLMNTVLDQAYGMLKGNGPKIVAIDPEVDDAHSREVEFMKGPAFKKWRGGKLLTPWLKRVLAGIFPSEYDGRSIFVGILEEIAVVGVETAEGCKSPTLHEGVVYTQVVAWGQNCFTRYDIEIQPPGDVPENVFLVQLRLGAGEEAHPAPVTESVPAGEVGVESAVLSGAPILSDQGVMPPVSGVSEKEASGEGSEPQVEKDSGTTEDVFEAAKPEGPSWRGISHAPETQRLVLEALYELVGEREFSLSPEIRGDLRKRLPLSLSGEEVDDKSIGKGIGAMSDHVKPPLLERLSESSGARKQIFKFAKAGLKLIGKTSAKKEELPKPKKTPLAAQPPESPVDTIERLKKVVRPHMKSLRSLDELEEARRELETAIGDAKKDIPTAAIEAWTILSAIERALPKKGKKK